MPGYVESLSRIIDFVAQLDDAETDKVEPMAHPLHMTQPLRVDAVTEENQRELFQTNASRTERGLYLVPKVIEVIRDHTLPAFGAPAMPPPHSPHGAPGPAPRRQDFPMHTRTLAELSAALHAREVSSVDLTRHFLGRIEALADSSTPSSP